MPILTKKYLYLGPMEFFENENLSQHFSFGLIKITPDLWSLDLFWPIKQKKTLHPTPQKQRVWAGAPTHPHIFKWILILQMLPSFISLSGWRIRNVLMRSWIHGKYYGSGSGKMMRIPWIRIRIPNTGLPDIIVYAFSVQ